MEKTLEGPLVWAGMWSLPPLQLGHRAFLDYGRGYFSSQHTCDVVITPEIHFYVVPLQHHAVLHAGLSDGHIHVVLGVERVY